ncbi:MAG: TetR/AcrR family transcriptional regulator [Lachnospiraceae bacterium]|nr:TetR/AcrR family transcriptional regulator [Lachnospiraceae bacterium]
MDKALTNRQKRALETRAKLIEAAKKVLAEKSFDEAAVEDITALAGVSTGSFYTYFKRKEDIVDAINDDTVFRLAEIVNKMTDLDINERIRFYCREYLNNIESHGLEICRQWLRNTLSPTEFTIFGENTTIWQHDFNSVEKILQEAIDRNELQKETPVREIAGFITAELYGLQSLWCMSDGKVNGAGISDRLSDLVLNAVLEKYRI